MRLALTIAVSALSLLIPGGLAPQSVVAQDPPKKAAAEPADKKGDKDAPSSKDEQKDPLKRWTTLQERRKQIAAIAGKLQKDFEKADEAGKKEILAAFQKLQTEFTRDIGPGLDKLAPEVLAKDPLNVDAAEVVAIQHYRENRYAKVIAIVDKLLDGGKSSFLLLLVDGISHFAVHDFEKAREVLTRASKEARTEDEKAAFDNEGAKFLGPASDYIEFWKQEQAIRAKEDKGDPLPHVRFKTNKGDIVLELFENEAPNTVANFVNLVETKKYDGTLFHRVIPGFMAQGGDPKSLDEDPSNDGTGGPGYKIACECYAPAARKHFQGTLSMAHAGKDTGGSQFFLTHLPTPHLNGKHTAFGRIVKGMDVAAALVKGDKIESATVLRKRKHEYVPKKIAG